MSEINSLGNRVDDEGEYIDEESKGGHNGVDRSGQVAIWAYKAPLSLSAGSKLCACNAQAGGCVGLRSEWRQNKWLKDVIVY